jgi:hypothetical protein
MDTLAGRLEYLRQHYHLLAPPSLLLLGIGLGASQLLAWIAGIDLAFLTINKLVGVLR